MTSDPVGTSEEDRDEIAERHWFSLLMPWLALQGSRRQSLTHLAHYCTFETLAGVVNNKELWFSPPVLMNDIDEIVAGKKLLLDNANEGSPVGDAMFALSKAGPEFWNDVREEFEERATADLEDTFVSCWSECCPRLRTHDDLTMWRGYAGEGNGVAVVADVSRFTGGAFDIISCPVFYESPDAFLARSVEAIRAFLVAYMNIPEDDREHYQYLAVEAFSDLLFYLSISHKHSAFAAEREWRFVWRRRRVMPSPFDSFVKAKVSPRGLIERFCLPLDGRIQGDFGSVDMHEMIVEVMVGPCDSQDAQVNGVRRLLHSGGFDLNSVGVTHSRIPFRHRRR